MQRRKLEALAESVVHFSGYREPGSALYLARNPGGLRAYSPKHAHDAEGHRVFGSVIDGLQALLFDVQLKLQGQSKAHLLPESTLADFAEACGQPSTAAQAYAKFLRKALGDESLNHRTALEFFLREE